MGATDDDCVLNYGLKCHCSISIPGMAGDTKNDLSSLPTYVRPFMSYRARYSTLATVKEKSGSSTSLASSFGGECFQVILGIQEFFRFHWCVSLHTQCKMIIVCLSSN